MEQVIPLRKRNADAVRREFLPAAMELEATPAGPMGRAVIWLIVSLFVFAVVWASIGKVDVIAVAEGSIVPAANPAPCSPPCSAWWRTSGWRTATTSRPASR
jgi:hemolysin D